MAEMGSTQQQLEKGSWKIPGATSSRRLRSAGTGAQYTSAQTCGVCNVSLSRATFSLGALRPVLRLGVSVMAVMIASPDRMHSNAALRSVRSFPSLCSSLAVTPFDYLHSILTWS